MNFGTARLGGKRKEADAQTWSLEEGPRVLGPVLQKACADKRLLAAKKLRRGALGAGPGQAAADPSEGQEGAQAVSWVQGVEGRS